jgi:hypothetical protein
VDEHGSWYTRGVATSKKFQKLDVATGVVWLQAFADKFHVDTAKWSVQPLDDTFGYQGLPDEAIAEKLADFLAAKYRVQTHVYEPMGSHWQVVVMQK